MSRAGFFIIALIASETLGQDPTVPNKAILERLKVASTGVSNIESAKAPALKLKAMVMVDSDHGTAIIEASAQRQFLRLDRGAINQSHNLSSESKQFVGIQIQDVTYRVVDFSERRVVLNDGTRDVFVQ